MRWLLLVLLAVVPALAQMRMTVAQLRSFLKSSVDLHQPDKQVADYLKKSKLTQRLAPGDFEEFSGMGVGPRTVEALRDLLTADQGTAGGSGARPRDGEEARPRDSAPRRRRSRRRSSRRPASTRSAIRSGCRISSACR